MVELLTLQVVYSLRLWTRDFKKLSGQLVPLEGKGTKSLALVSFDSHKLTNCYLVHKRPALRQYSGTQFPSK